MSAVSWITFENLFGATQVARKFKVSRATVSRWARKGLLRGVKVAGTRWCFSKEDLSEFERTRRK